MDWIKSLFTIKRPGGVLPVAPGLYHAMKEADGMYTHFHLRVENDGMGMLIANARAAAQLTPSGVVIAKGLLDGKGEEDILKSLNAAFRGTDDAIIRNDIAKVHALITEIVTPGDTYPVYNLEDASISPYSTALIAPLQASLTLAAPEILVPVIDKLWAVGIPHITLLAPLNPNPAHLIRAVERAEDLGMIAGVRGRASDLHSGALLEDLRVAGVDHVTFPFASMDAAVHDALCGDGDHAAANEMLAWLEAQQICAVAEIPLVQTTLTAMDETVAALIPMGADNFSFVAYVTLDAALAGQEGIFTADAMPQVATLVEEATEAANARFIWNPPVQRNPALTLPAQVQAGPRCSGDMAVRIEAHDQTEAVDIIPARGPYQSAGDLLHDPWKLIWNHPVFREYRERVEKSTRCDVCPGLAICAADCPREPAGWAQ
ncbi:MAG: radical SAM protein [Anaerolineae bacterium]|nr:radical SAM protein [Anaerolineae bacterium]